MARALMQRGSAAGRRLSAAVAILVAAFATLTATAPAQKIERLALIAAIEGAIGPATDHLIQEAINEATERGVEVLILRLNTPGGLVSSTRDIIERIVAAPVPVVGYVAPAGAHAASAGTYILYSTHVAAMAPGTNIGAATPVMLGGAPELPGAPPATEPAKPADDDSEVAPDKEGEATPPALAPGDAMNAKVTNDAVAFIRSLAELRGRNADWAEKAVRQAATLTASEALELKVIEIVAEDAEDLLDALDGRTVRVVKADHVLATKGIVLEAVEPSWLTQLLGVIANPNVALPLMLIGVYGLIFEFATPGTLGPGIFGAIALILGFYALNQLPLNHAGLALLMLGIGLMVAEAVTPSFGVLGAGGIAAFLIGGAFLIDTDAPEFQLSWTVLATSAALSGGFFVIVLGFIWRAYRRPVATGATRLLGAEAEVLEWAGGEGYVWAEGERWRANGVIGLAAGGKVRIIGLDGLVLRVAAD